MRELFIENNPVIDVFFFCFSNRLFYGTNCLHRRGGPHVSCQRGILWAYYGHF